MFKKGGVILNRQKQLILAREDLEEALKLVEISRSLFQKKLSNLKRGLDRETDRDKIKKLLDQSERLYCEYKESLSIIETYMDVSFQKTYSQ